MRRGHLFRPFASPDAYFAEVRALAAGLSASGHADAAAELREGFRSVNGLTDGWALFHETIEAVARRYGRVLTTEQRERLAAVRGVADRITHRH